VRGASGLSQGTRVAGNDDERSRRKKTVSLPLLHVQGKEKGEQCRSKRHCSAPFFFFKYETASFRIKRVVSFKKKRRQNASISKSALNYLLFISIASLSIS
jgi:hypothetical protein